MLKINLLPPYIHQKKMVKVAAGVVTVLLVGEIVVMLAMRAGPEAEKTQLTNRLNEVQAEFAKLNPLKTEADTILAAEGGMAPKFDFLTGMDKYNTEYPELYSRTAAYTYREATILNLSASANQLQFDAYVSRPRDVSLLILGLSRSSDFTGLPQVTGVPGFDPAKEAEREQAANAALPEATVIGGMQPGMAPAGGYPGMPGGEMAGGYPGMPGGGNGPGGGMMGGAPEMPGASSAMMEGAMSGYPGAEGGMMGGGGKGDLSKLGIDQAVAKPRGFTVSVTCALRTTITRPKYGSSDQQAGAGGGGGGYPGMSGEMPGMMGAPPMAGGMNGP